MDLSLSSKINILEKSHLRYYVCFFKMALLKYFKPTKAPTVSILPLPSGPLSEVMPTSSIEAANMQVKSVVLESQISSKNDAASTRASTMVMKRGPYVKFSQQAKVSMVKYALEYGLDCAYLPVGLDSLNGATEGSS